MKKKSRMRKRKINLKKFSISIIIIFLIAYVSVTFIKQRISLDKREKLVEAYEEEIQNANLKKEQLEKELENSKDAEYTERMAREKLGLVKANERVFIDVTKE